MITYSNIRRFDDLEFGKYTQLQGYSHSFLKSERNGETTEFVETMKTRLGKLVDQILTDPAKANMRDDLYPTAKSIAFEIQKVFGVHISKLEKQISYVADLRYNDHVLTTTGRLDFLLPGHAVIDLKVMHTRDVDGLIRYWGYENQLWHYANLAQVKKKYIMAYSVPLKKTFMKDLGVVSPTSDFWAAKIEKFGEPICV